MRDYSKVGPQFWIGKTGKKLRAAGAKAQLVGLYLMTSPHANMLGLYYVSTNSIGHETGLGIEGALEGLRSCIEAGFCSYDEETEMVWVHEMAYFQIADKLAAADKRSTGVQNEYDALPDNPYLGDFFEKYADAFNMKRNRKADNTPFEAPSKPLRSQEQEQEQDQEQEQEQEQALRAVEPSPATMLSIAFKAAGVQSQPADPRLMALAEQGVSSDTVAAACAEAKRAKPGERIGVAYVIGILNRWSADAGKVSAGRASPQRAPAINEKFNFSHLDHSSSARAMAESMERHGITVPDDGEEIEI